MAITFRGAVSNPADGAVLFDSTERNIDPRSLNCVTGDLIRLVVHRRGGTDVVMNKTGGQTWTAGTLRQTGSSSAKVFWCRFNGTWDAANLPSITSVASATATIQFYLEAWIPTAGSNTWALDVSETFHTYNAPVSPGQVTATGVTTLTNGALTIADFLSLGNNTWSNQSSGTGWANPSAAYYRDFDNVGGRSVSISSLYKILVSAGATGNPTDQQGGTFTAGMTIVNAFKEQASGVTVNSVSTGATPILDGQTSITIAGASFGASHTGSADIIVSPSNNIADAGAVTQTQTAWSDTSLTFTANLSSFQYFTTIYLFVKNSSGSSNATGFQIKRGATVKALGVLKNLAGSAQASLTNVRWRMTAGSLVGTEVGHNNNGTSDGSGNFATDLITLADTSILNPNTADPVWLVAGVDGGSLATSYSFVGKVTPTYA